MNQFTNVLQNCTQHNLGVTDTLTSYSIPNTTKLDPSSIISIGDYSITAEQLTGKLQLLDRIIADYYPELLV